MDDFIPAKKLKKDFYAEGRFYSVGGQNFRSLLEIYHKDYYRQLKETNEFDAIFIMMNPGKGCPKNKGMSKELTKTEVDQGYINKVPLVSAKPDITQYQIMRIMKKKKWNYVKVINLHDMKQSKSSEFYKVSKTITPTSDGSEYSIFINSRRNELIDIFSGSKKYEIITAWGVNENLALLIDLAINCNLINTRKGIFKTDLVKGNNFYYYHPLPTLIQERKNWLNNILSII